MDTLDRVQNLSKLYRYEKIESAYDDDGRKRRRTVRVSHNAAALSKAKDRYFEGIREIGAMNYCSLADVEKRIAELVLEFDAFRYNSMTVEEVTPQRNADLRPKEKEKGQALEAIHTAGPGSDLLILGESESARWKRKLHKMELELGRT
jgi:hypothetical protein